MVLAGSLKKKKKAKKKRTSIVGHHLSRMQFECDQIFLRLCVARFWMMCMRQTEGMWSVLLFTLQSVKDSCLHLCLLVQSTFNGSLNVQPKRIAIYDCLFVMVTKNDDHSYRKARQPTSTSSFQSGCNNKKNIKKRKFNNTIELHIVFGYTNWMRYPLPPHE